MSLIPVLATWIVWGLINLVIASKAAEHRIDAEEPDSGGMGTGLSNQFNRFRAANYSSAGQPWRRPLTWSVIAQTLFLLIGGWLALARSAAA